MSVRRRTYRNPISGAVNESWTVDVDFHHADGRRERIRRISPVPTRRGAEQYERDVRAALLAGTFGRKEAANFKEFVTDRWLATYPASAGNRQSTIEEKASHCLIHLIPFFGRFRMDQIDGELVARFFAHLRKVKASGRVRSEKTIKNVRATLRRILASAMEWKEISTIPELPKVKVPESQRDFYTREETDSLLAACRGEEERALLLFAIRTGARAGEQIAFEWGDIDWHRHEVVFRRSSTRGLVGPTKSGRIRKVPMTAGLEATLRKVKHLRGRLVFCRMDGAPLTIDQLHEHLWGVIRRAGLRRVRWHDLRHSFASQAVIVGVPVTQVQAWLGHSTITMTMRYAHLAPGSGSNWIERLEIAPSQRHSDGTAGSNQDNSLVKSRK
jgi:integrase